MELFLIRHFKTQGNLEGRYIGSTDEPILEGVQNGGAGKIYPTVEKIVSSPLMRCVQTTGKIFGKAPDLICEDLRETDFGKYEGKNFQELKDEPAYKKWLESNGTLPFPEGERNEDFVKRTTDGFEKMLEILIEENCSTAAFVVHGGTIMAILSAYAESGKGFYDWQVKNGSGYRIVFDEMAWNNGNRKWTEVEQLG